jgi:hypothetical protein
MTDPCEHSNELSGFMKYRAISCINEDLLANQEGLWSSELVT